MDKDYRLQRAHAILDERVLEGITGKVEVIINQGSIVHVHTHKQDL